MTIKAPKEVNLDFAILAQKFDLNPYEGASLQLEGLYHHSKTNPSLVWVEGTILFFCALFNPLENIKDGMIIQIEGEVKQRAQRLPSGKKQVALALDVQKTVQKPIMSSYEFKQKVLAPWQEAIREIIATETGLRTIATGEAEEEIIQRIMYIPQEQQWLIGAYLHPPQDQTGSAIYILCNKDGKPLKQIISRLKAPAKKTK
ncbi:MAG: hypothetical protein ACFFC7_03710 [Candidatus Hermodarchaeota archaeon]